MRRRRHSPRTLLLICFAVVVSACSGGGADEATSTTAVTPTTVTASTTPGAATDPAYDEPIELDPEVRTGVLENGLTYYVRENDAPGSRLQLRLAIDAGSVLEDDDQPGVAHFLEHMLFNGTERWPENELIPVLESFGTQFGPDVNAFTSYDETVYQLSVATDQDTVDLAFEVLREWASRASIDQTDVEEERGVVIEEWRLRDQGIGGRISTLFEDALLAGSSYEGRSPIGDEDALAATDAAELRRFYEDWYRPELMAVIAVGDLPVAQLEAEIIERFSDLENPDDPRVRSEPVVPTPTEAKLIAFADPDLPSAFAEFLYPTAAIPAGSYGALRDRMAVQLAFDMVARRLNDDIVSGGADFFSVGAVEIPFARAIWVPGIEVDADAQNLGSSIGAIAREVERVRRFGFTDAEYLRVVEDRRAIAAQALASESTRQDVEHAGALVDAFLAGVPAPAAQVAFDLEMRALDELTVDRVEQDFVKVVSGAPSVLAVGPETYAAALPTERQMAEILDLVSAGDIEPRPADTEVADRLMERPEPVEIVARSTDIFDVTWLTFGNGAVVGLIPTAISENTVVFSASSPGGVSVADAPDAAEAIAISDIVASSGVGDFDAIGLERLLVGRVVSVTPYLGNTDEGFFGDAATEDLETLFQLVHLYMTEPRADETALDTMIGQMRPLVEAPLAVPGLAGDVTLLWARYGRDNPWFGLPELDEFDAFDLATGLAVYEDRFGDAGDFVFALAGDFDPAVVEDLAARYLGTLPGSDRDDGFVDRAPDPPSSAVVETVRVGADAQGDVTFLFTGNLEATAEDRIHLRLLELVATTRLRDRLREALAATYSPLVLVEAVGEPDPVVETYVQVSGDPERIAEISQEVLAVLADLAAGGPTEAELATAREQLTREYELVSNEFWVETLVFYALHPDESLVDVSRRLTVVAAATADDVRRVAAIAFPADRYIEVRQLPE